MVTPSRIPSSRQVGDDEAGGRGQGVEAEEGGVVGHGGPISRGRVSLQAGRLKSPLGIGVLAVQLGDTGARGIEAVEPRRKSPHGRPARDPARRHLGVFQQHARPPSAARAPALKNRWTAPTSARPSSLRASLGLRCSLGSRSMSASTASAPVNRASDGPDAGGAVRDGCIFCCNVRMWILHGRRRRIPPSPHDGSMIQAAGSDLANRWSSESWIRTPRVPTRTARTRPSRIHRWTVRGWWPQYFAAYSVVRSGPE